MIAWLEKLLRWLKPNNVKVKGSVSDTPNGTARQGGVEAEWRLK